MDSDSNTIDENEYGPISSFGESSTHKSEENLVNYNKRSNPFNETNIRSREASKTLNEGKKSGTNI